MAGASGKWGEQPSFSSKLKNWWEEESLVNSLFVKPALSAAMLPGEVYRGEVPLQTTEGHTSPELIERSLDFAGTLPMAGLASGARPAKDVLFSGLGQVSDDPWIAELAAKMAPAELPPSQFLEAYQAPIPIDYSTDFPPAPLLKSTTGGMSDEEFDARGQRYLR